MNNDIDKSTVISTMKVRNSDRYIDIIYEWDEDSKKYKIYTDETIYGNRQEIIYSNEVDCFVIKNIKKLKEKWNEDHGISDNPFDKFLELENGMQDL